MKKVDDLIKRLNNKILLGNVYAERFLHPMDGEVHILI